MTSSSARPALTMVGAADAEACEGDTCLIPALPGDIVSTGPSSTPQD